MPGSSSSPGKSCMLGKAMLTERRQWGAGVVCGQAMEDGVDDFLGAW